MGLSLLESNAVAAGGMYYVHTVPAKERRGKGGQCASGGVVWVVCLSCRGNIIAGNPKDSQPTIEDGHEAQLRCWPGDPTA